MHASRKARAVGAALLTLGTVAALAACSSGSNSSNTGTPAGTGTSTGSGSTASAGGTYNFFSGVNINGSGQVTYIAGLTGGSSTQGIFDGLAGSVQAVALQGGAAPAGS